MLCKCHRELSDYVAQELLHPGTSVGNSFIVGCGQLEAEGENRL